MKTKLISSLTAIACVIAVGGTTLLSSAPASAGGFLGDIVNGVLPGAGTGLDEWNREFKDRQSSESVWNQVMNAQIPNAPFRPAQAPTPMNSGPPPMFQQAGPLGNFCATNGGVFGPGPVNPVGAPCNAATQWGVFYGQVVQR
jgi:hypothetical protein